jgi:hypothetical protein
VGFVGGDFSELTADVDLELREAVPTSGGDLGVWGVWNCQARSSDWSCGMDGLWVRS